MPSRPTRPSRPSPTSRTGPKSSRGPASAEKRPRKDPLASRRRRRRLRGRLRTVVIVGVVAVLLVVGLWAVFLSSWLAARTVSVEGGTSAQRSQVASVARVPIGRPLARVDLSAIQARVEGLPIVRSASVSRSWPHSVRITVVVRRPVAVVDRGSGLQYLDRYGVVFGRPARAGGLPLIKAAPSMDTTALSGAGAVAGSLPTGLSRRVAYLQLRSADDIELLLHDGQRVLWGSAADSGQKAEVAAVLLRKKTSIVDVSVPGRPATRP